MFENQCNTLYQKTEENQIMIILLDAEKAFSKINIHSWLQNFRKPGIEGNFFNLMKIIYKKTYR